MEPYVVFDVHVTVAMAGRANLTRARYARYCAVVKEGGVLESGALTKFGCARREINRAEMAIEPSPVKSRW